MLPRYSVCLLLCLIFAGATPAQEDLRARVEAAAPLTVEDVCSPIRTTRGGQPELVLNPDGKTYDALFRYYNTYWGPHTTYAVELATGEIVAKDETPSALYGWGTIGPDGRKYQHSPRNGGVAICGYDAAKNEFFVMPNFAPVGGEVMPMTVGTDGLLYGGGASKDSRATAYQVDVKTGAIKDFGPMGPSHAPNACWGYSIAVDEKFIYMASGKIPWYLVALNKETGEEKVLLTLDDPRGHMAASQLGHGCMAMSKGGDGAGTYYWLHEGKAIERKDPKEKAPWTEPEGAVAPVRPPQPELGLAGAVPKADGKVLIWYRTAEAKAAAPKDTPADATPEAQGWKKIEFEVPTFPTPVLELLALPDGRVYGSGESYTGNFLYDPKTNKSDHLGTLPLSQYCMTQKDGIVYMSGYPSSVVFSFDPAKPWTPNLVARPWDKPLVLTDKNSNPRQLTYLTHAGAGTHKMWSATAGADGKLYFGGRWYRNGEGGGLGWWDPKEQKAGGISQPFANYQINYICPAADGRYIVISTNCVRDQATNTDAPETARLFVFDTTTMQIVRHVEPVAKAMFAGAIADAGDGCVLGITLDPADRAGAPEKDDLGNPPSYGSFDKSSILYKVNVATGEVVWSKSIPYPVGFRANENAQGHDGFDFTRGPDGMIWTYTGAKFVRSVPDKKWNYSYLNPVMVRIDPKDGAVTVVGKLDRGGRMAFVEGDLYLSGGCRYLTEVNHALRRIRGIVGR